MKTIVVKPKPEEEPLEAPFTMTIEINGTALTIDTWPSAWIQDMTLDEDFTMSEEVFLERLEAEWGISTTMGLVDVLYEAHMWEAIIRSASVKVQRR